MLLESIAEIQKIAKSVHEDASIVDPNRKKYVFEESETSGKTPFGQMSRSDASSMLADKHDVGLPMSKIARSMKAFIEECIALDTSDDNCVFDAYFLDSQSGSPMKVYIKSEARRRIGRLKSIGPDGKIKYASLSRDFFGIDDLETTLFVKHNVLARHLLVACHRILVLSTRSAKDTKAWIRAPPFPEPSPRPRFNSRGHGNATRDLMNLFEWETSYTADIGRKILSAAQRQDAKNKKGRGAVRFMFNCELMWFYTSQSSQSGNTSSDATRTRRQNRGYSSRYDDLELETVANIEALQWEDRKRLLRCPKPVYIYDLNLCIELVDAHLTASLTSALDFRPEAKKYYAVADGLDSESFEYEDGNDKNFSSEMIPHLIGHGHFRPATRPKVEARFIKENYLSLQIYKASAFGKRQLVDVPLEKLFHILYQDVSAFEECFSGDVPSRDGYAKVGLVKPDQIQLEFGKGKSIRRNKGKHVPGAAFYHSGLSNRKKNGVRESLWTRGSLPAETDADPDNQSGFGEEFLKEKLFKERERKTRKNARIPREEREYKDLYELPISKMRVQRSNRRGVLDIESCIRVCWNSDSSRSIRASFGDDVTMKTLFSNFVLGVCGVRHGEECNRNTKIFEREQVNAVSRKPNFVYRPSSNAQDPDPGASAGPKFFKFPMNQQYRDSGMGMTRIRDEIVEFIKRDRERNPDLSDEGRGALDLLSDVNNLIEIGLFLADCLIEMQSSAYVSNEVGNDSIVALYEKHFSKLSMKAGLEALNEKGEYKAADEKEKRRMRKKTMEEYQHISTDTHPAFFSRIFFVRDTDEGSPERLNYDQEILSIFVDPVTASLTGHYCDNVAYKDSLETEGIEVWGWKLWWLRHVRDCLINSAGFKSAFDGDVGEKMAEWSKQSKRSKQERDAYVKESLPKFKDRPMSKLQYLFHCYRQETKEEFFSYPPAKSKAWLVVGDKGKVHLDCFRMTDLLIKSEFDANENGRVPDPMQTYGKTTTKTSFTEWTFKHRRMMIAKDWPALFGRASSAPYGVIGSCIPQITDLRVNQGAFKPEAGSANLRAPSYSLESLTSWAGNIESYASTGAMKAEWKERIRYFDYAFENDTTLFLDRGKRNPQRTDGDEADLRRKNQNDLKAANRRSAKRRRRVDASASELGVLSRLKFEYDDALTRPTGMMAGPSGVPPDDGNEEAAQNRAFFSDQSYPSFAGLGNANPHDYQAAQDSMQGDDDSFLFGDDEIEAMMGSAEPAPGADDEGLGEDAEDMEAVVKNAYVQSEEEEEERVQDEEELNSGDDLSETPPQSQGIASTLDESFELLTRVETWDKLQLHSVPRHWGVDNMAQITREFLLLFAQEGRHHVDDESCLPFLFKFPKVPAAASGSSSGAPADVPVGAPAPIPESGVELPIYSPNEADVDDDTYELWEDTVEGYLGLYLNGVVSTLMDAFVIKVEEAVEASAAAKNLWETSSRLKASVEEAIEVQIRGQLQTIIRSYSQLLKPQPEDAMQTAKEGMEDAMREMYGDFSRIFAAIRSIPDFMEENDRESLKDRLKKPIINMETIVPRSLKLVIYEYIQSHDGLSNSDYFSKGLVRGIEDISNATGLRENEGLLYQISDSIKAIWGPEELAAQDGYKIKLAPDLENERGLFLPGAPVASGYASEDDDSDDMFD